MGNKMLEKYKYLPVQMKASFWFLICSFLQRGISMITTPIFTRLLSIVEYGQYSVFNSWLSVITVFVTLNLFSGVYMQGIIKYEDDRRIFVSSMQGLCTTLVAIWTVIYLVFRDFWNKIFSLTTTQMVAMLLMIWLSAVFSFWAVEQRVIYNYRALVIVTLVTSFAKPIVGILFVLLADDKVTARIIGLVLVEFISYFGFFVIQMYRGKVFYSKKYWIYALSFNLPLVPHYLSQTVLNSADRIMIDNMVGSDAAGIYSLAYSISLIMTLFNTSISQTLGPWVYQRIKGKKITDIAPVAYMLLILIAIINLFFIALAPEIVTFFAPKSYYEAIWVIPPVTMSVYFMFCYDLFAKFGFYYEKTKTIMLASIVGAIMNIVLNYYFIGLFGYYAAGYTTLACYVIYVVGHYCFMNKICNEYLDGVRPYNTRIILAISGIFMAVGFLFLCTYNSRVLRFLLLMIGCIILFVNRAFLVKSVEELSKIKKGS